MNLPDLPIRAVLPELTSTLAARGSMILVAPPGTGKTTVVPLALPGRIVVAEPRRLAARAAAARMAASLGEPVGRTVGYAVRGDRRTSKDTRIEVVTSGLLVRRIQHDPELSGVDTVLLDECHERHLDADLLLALLTDAIALRPDLKLLATSATVAAERLAELLGDAPVLKADARTFPTETTYLPPARGERVEATVARATRLALSETDGDVLVFLPGAAEINRVRQMLDGVNVVTLHGRLAAKDQDAALKPTNGQRVVLATAVAESSLTVPGVRAVVDSGLSRVPRVDHRRGLPGLATVRTSAAVADQRAGRAGREGPGRVYRCWPEHEQSTLPRYPEPEIRVADLTRLALELACWGTPDGSALRWWDAPPEGALKAGQAVLRDLHAVNEDGTPTDRGRRMADVGLHPRLARALLDGGKQAADVVALLDDDSLADDVDLETALRKVKSSQRWRRESQRLAALAPRSDKPTDAAEVIALAYPERLARKRSADSRVYLMANGTAVELPPGTGLDHRDWLAIAVADRRPGEKHGRVRLAAAADLDLATGIIGVSEEDMVTWDGDVVARRVQRLGAIVLSGKPISDPDPAVVEAALRAGIRAEGVSILDWDAKLHARMALLHRTLGDPWPAVGQDAILSSVDVSGARNRKDLARINPLRAMLPWPAAARLDELAPERVEVPSGSRIAVDYAGERPVLAVRLQEIFGWRQAPAIADGKVTLLLHVLSPAGRPAAVTDDLESFWANGYPRVRAELRGRYPKHDWPSDPLTAIPRSRRRSPR
ncbi:ATP-dependent helicase HrpB [Kibdelosporangium persicum]|uniref:ATP-dependent RNA helicase HrpB n=1 Tax=Kibdelosporangium persicum TaxID=2698649 RepID=A0ABX2F888_9PSEU|nr:ATP-dependent helicase HrpB [Kibdelosporangium persicum]NRN67349.1 ATP-dependent RNA helicase HrpB [Kibdelosporangium persicum]